MRTMLLGAPGAGKGTHCKKIVDAFGVKHLSSGDILRQERAEGTDLGKQAQSYMDSGALVPDDLIVAMMAGAIEAVSEQGFVLDGFPRTVVQAEALDKALDAQGNPLDCVVNLQVGDDVIADRMTGRRSCPDCGAVFHATNMKPKVDGICDACGGKLIQRPDDTLEVVKKRLETYHEQTEPVIGYYREQGKVKDIDAEQAPDVVGEQVISMLKSVSV